MSLSDYKKKRNFRKTPEPADDKSAGLPGSQFVVQKHAARQLHYDFRLELDGTLKSWAVPKGPSLDPTVKSLAVHVEDHPLSYAEFEGTIPKGQYGGGTVMVWDHGIWEPLTDPVKGLKSGKLKFTLHGEKLRGEWTLVRMGGSRNADGKNWLLIKHGDDEARPAADFDVLQEAEHSVLTGRSLDQISENKPAKKKAAAKRKSRSQARASAKPTAENSAAKTSPAGTSAKDLTRAKSAKMPTRLKPELATLADAIPPGEDWLHELKFDGYRLLLFLQDGKVKVMTRNAKNWTKRFPEIVAAAEQLPISNAIIDGEVVVLDNDGVTDFQRLQNHLDAGSDQHALTFYGFDLPFADGMDLTACPLIERKQLLASLLLNGNPDNSGTLRYSDHIRGDGQRVIDHACRFAMEGVISKRVNSRYQQRRSPDWLKIKCMRRQEFVIGGYTRPSGSRKGFGALLLGYFEDKQLIYCGKVGTGFTQESLQQVHAALEQIAVRKNPFDTEFSTSQKRGVSWVQPKLVAEVEFSEWTQDGQLRHPSFKGLRDDKPPTEIVREQRLPRVSAAASASPAANSNADVMVAGVRLSHPNRVVFPDAQITKLQLARFYEQISDWILPYIVDRPLTLVRCPKGRSGKCFYQKHLTESMPEQLQGITIEEQDGEKSVYVVVNDLPGLLSLVQMGVLEMHPWPAKRDRLDRPDQLVFDLDPGEGVDTAQISSAAAEVHERLQQLGLTSFLRTSGGKGLHVVVPLTRRNSWDELKQFAKGFAARMAKAEPQRYVDTASKAKRRGKVFVDYLRNQRGATAIASYSTRARENAPVATPLDWQELTPKLQPDAWTVNNLPNRLRALKTDPWQDFFQQRQSLTQAILQDVAAR